MSGEQPADWPDDCLHPWDTGTAEKPWTHICGLPYQHEGPHRCIACPEERPR
jgi:hypothetical protein